MSAEVNGYITYLETCKRFHRDSTFYLERLVNFIKQPEEASEREISCIEFDPSQPNEGPESIDVDKPKQGCRVVCVSGFPSPATISHLGKKFFPRPELLLGHLELERTIIQKPTSFELPALPSRRDNIVHIRFIRLFRTGTRKASLGSDFEKLSQERQDAIKMTLEYEKILMDKRLFGATRFRKVNVHSFEYFSVEQLVSFSVAEVANGFWTGIYLIDRGKGVQIRPDVELPWCKYLVDKDQQPEVLPVVDYNDLDGDSFLDIPEELNQKPENYLIHPHHPLLACFRTQDQDLLGKYPFVICARTLAVAAASWNQLLNYLEADIDNCQRVKPKKFQGGLAQLQYNISLIKNFQGAISDNRNTADDKGSAGWPWPEKSHSSEEWLRMEKIRKDLLRDYDELSVRCQSLLRRCEAASGLLINRISIEEARRSVDQAELVSRFTRLAFVFIPLSFVASVFGMNVSEIQGNFPSIWTFFLVATIISMASLILAMTSTQRTSWIDLIRKWVLGFVGTDSTRIP